MAAGGFLFLKSKHASSSEVSDGRACSSVAHAARSRERLVRESPHCPGLGSEGETEAVVRASIRENRKPAFAGRALDETDSLERILTQWRVVCNLSHVH